MSTPVIGSKAAEADILIKQGSTFDETLPYTDSDDVAIDLTGFTARLTAKIGYSGAVLLTLTTENGGIVLGGALGTIQIIVTAVVTAALDPVDFAAGTVVYDLELISGAGAVDRLLEGHVTLSQEVTT